MNSNNQTNSQNKSNIVTKFLEKGILIEYDVYNAIKTDNKKAEFILNILHEKSISDFILTTDFFNNYLGKKIETGNALQDASNLLEEDSVVDGVLGRDIGGEQINIINSSHEESTKKENNENTETKKKKLTKTTEKLDELRKAIYETRVYETKEVNETTVTNKTADVKIETKIDALQGRFNGLKLVYSFSEQSKKYTVDDFTNYFKYRYNKLREVLAGRKELENLVSINKIGFNRQRNEKFSIIGTIFEKRITKNGNVFLEIEDATGTVKVVVSKNNPELFDRAENLTQDEVIGIVCTGTQEFLFANNIIMPDAFRAERKTGGEGYALFISDIHVGSKKFMEKNLLKFISWLNLEDEKHNIIAEQTKYVFVLGDIVDGIGIYPGQENELAIRDISEQYEHCEYLLSQIRKDVKLIMIPGNHDASAQTDPQVLDEQLASPLFRLKNIVILSSPSLINVGSILDGNNGNGFGNGFGNGLNGKNMNSMDGRMNGGKTNGKVKNFSGYDVLLYHGSSLNYYGNNIKNLIKLGYENPSTILKYLLQKRHLSPTHGATRYLPTEKDPLLIEHVPDILAVGDLHKSSASYHNNILLLSCSCWQARTSFQERLGLVPDTCIVPAFDMKSGKISMLDFN